MFHAEEQTNMDLSIWPRSCRLSSCVETIALYLINNTDTESQRQKTTTSDVSLCSAFAFAACNPRITSVSKKTENTQGTGVNWTASILEVSFHFSTPFPLAQDQKSSKRSGDDKQRPLAQFRRYRRWPAWEEQGRFPSKGLQAHNLLSCFPSTAVPLYTCVTLYLTSD